ncbi:MAG: hypothetical protein WEG36_08035 [Gemmatimonadota bacterium]
MDWLIGASLVAALAYGIWLGMPRRYEQPLEEIEERLSEEGEHQTVKRHFTFLNLLQKNVERGSHRRRRGSARRPFDLR